MINGKKISLKYTTLLLLVAAIFVTCVKPPSYPNEPSITFDNLRLIDNEFGFDTIILTVYFKDGNGDMGLTADEIDAPYNAYEIQKDNAGKTLKFGDVGTPAFNFWDYEIINGDTIYVLRNPHFFNFLVEFYVKNSNGEFEHKEYRQWCIDQGVCIPFHGRYEPISDWDREEPLEGTISYTMSSTQFPKGDMFFKISLYDRALNLSNEVSSDTISIQ